MTQDQALRKIFSGRDKIEDHGGKVGEFAKAHDLDPRKVIDFSSNVSPIGPPKSALKAVKEALEEIDRYPENLKELQKALADYVDVRPSNILPANGSVDLIYQLTNFYKPRRVAIFSPTFSEYERAAYSIGAEVIDYPRNKEFEIDDRAALGALDNADLVFICNPNNPTANVTPRDILMRIRRLAPKTLIVIDEAFMDFIADEKKYSMIPHAAADEKTVVVRSLGKFFSLAGLRIGFLVAHKGVIESLESRQPPWNINRLAYAASLAAVKDKGYIRTTKKKMEELRRRFENELKLIPGLKVYDSEVNFILLKIKARKFDNKFLQGRLAGDQFLIRLTDDFEGLEDYYFRVSVRKTEENSFFADTLRRIFQ